MNRQAANIVCREAARRLSLDTVEADFGFYGWGVDIVSDGVSLATFDNYGEAIRWINERAARVNDETLVELYLDGEEPAEAPECVTTWGDFYVNNLEAIGEPDLDDMRGELASLGVATYGGGAGLTTRLVLLK